MRKFSAAFQLSGTAARSLAWAILFGLGACDRSRPIATWEGESLHDAVEPERAELAITAVAVPVTVTHFATPELRFVSYNLQNWLTMERNGGLHPKPESERAAAVKIIAASRPDLLGLCEIGSKDDLIDLQQRLANAGIDLPYRHHTGGADDTRHLGFLSRLPLGETVSHRDHSFEVDGKRMRMNRGILDLSVATDNGKLRFLGVHLKSKREVPGADQEMIRRAEAHILRRQVDAILRANPNQRLIVYGDINDTRGSSTIRIIRGPRNAGLKLNMVFLRDQRDETWTHHWGYQDVYSRFDYVFVSGALLQSIEWDDCRILDDPLWVEASDHRALLVVLK